MTNDRRDRMVSPGKALHWFNPENDLALASGLTNYTPPKAALTIRRSGECLPLWYGDDHDIVICPETNQKWLDRVRQDFNLHTSATDTLHSPTTVEPRPWGWSAYARRYFERLGLRLDVLPSHAQIDTMRMLSHRRTASLMAQRLKEMLPDENLAAPAVECHTIGNLTDFLTLHPAAYLKSPWSSSGRGVVCTSAMIKEKVLRFALDSISHQGSVMAEHAYRKTRDFAMLFECREGRTFPAGTSVFLTDRYGAYTGNLLAPEEVRFATIARYIDAGLLTRVRECLLLIIDELIAPFYNGVLGIDMLVSDDGTLNATVELNLRTTMGYVAARFADRHMWPDARGVMRSVHVRATDDIHENYIAENGMLAKGLLYLSPPKAGFIFLAEVEGAAIC